MAEIRSTLEMVMERAARLEAEAGDSARTEATNQEGMRLAARYLREEEDDFSSLLSRPAGEQALLIQGALTTLLRNIPLPRDEADQAGADRAMQGMLQLGQAPELQTVIAEIKKILSQFLQHREQLRGQLEEQFSQHMAAMEQSVGQQTGVQVRLEPSQHPKFAEEWQKVLIQLNDKYGKALDQHKEYLRQLLVD